MRRRIVLLGPPGSGKGTIARLLEERFRLEHFSTGHWFRGEIEAGSEIGRKVAGYVERGDLIPDELVLGLVARWLSAEHLREGYLLDGFPRTRLQAEELDRFCAAKGAAVDVVIYLSCPEDVIVERITGRRVCSSCGRNYHVRTLPPRSPGVCDECGGPLIQRSDDTEEVVRKRLAFYREVTEPLVDYYQKSGKLVSLNGAQDAEAAFKDAAQVVES